MVVLLVATTVAFMVLSMVLEHHKKEGTESKTAKAFAFLSIFSGFIGFLVILTISPTLNRAGIIKYEVHSAENYVTSYTEEVKVWEARDTKDPVIFNYLQESKQDLSRAKVQLENTKDKLNKLEQAKWWWNFNLF